MLTRATRVLHTDSLKGRGWISRMPVWAFRASFLDTSRLIHVWDVTTDLMLIPLSDTARVIRDKIPCLAPTPEAWIFRMATSRV